jgi:hypothetical protein
LFPSIQLLLSVQILHSSKMAPRLLPPLQLPPLQLPPLQLPPLQLPPLQLLPLQLLPLRLLKHLQLQQAEQLFQCQLLVKALPKELSRDG